MTLQRKAWLVVGVGGALLMLLMGAAKLSDMLTGANVVEHLPATPELIERGAYQHLHDEPAVRSGIKEVFRHKAVGMAGLKTW